MGGAGILACRRTAETNACSTIMTLACSGEALCKHFTSRVGPFCDEFEMLDPVTKKRLVELFRPEFAGRAKEIRGVTIGALFLGLVGFVLLGAVFVFLLGMILVGYVHLPEESTQGDPGLAWKFSLAAAIYAVLFLAGIVASHVAASKKVSNFSNTFYFDSRSRLDPTKSTAHGFLTYVLRLPNFCRMALSNLLRWRNITWVTRNVPVVVDWLDFFEEPQLVADMPRRIRPCTPKEVDTALETLRRMEYLRVVSHEDSEKTYFQRSVYADEIFDQVGPSRPGGGPFIPPTPEGT